ncbi:MAG: hypothetical protein WEA09_08035 [Gemmatimonadota bacterium]
MNTSGPEGQASRARMATGLVLGLVFVTGALLGAAFNRWYVEPAFPAEVTTAPEVESAEANARTSLVYRVGLSEDQALVADSLVEVWRERVEHLQKVYRDSYWAVIDSTRDALRVHLEMDPEQLVRYDSLIHIYDRRNEGAPRTPPSSQ